MVHRVPYQRRQCDAKALIAELNEMFTAFDAIVKENNSERIKTIGGTINTAARMESNSEPMRINVSQELYNQVKDRYRFTERAPIEVKGKGKMTMFFWRSENCVGIAERFFPTF